MGTDRPTVTIGMPTYNAERWLPKTLDSLQAQTFEDFELVISDNASTDDTGDICQSYAARDSRIRYFRQQRNLGVNGNYNAVLDLGVDDCDYFKWASSNDVCEPTFLERCVDVLRSRPDVGLCYSRTLLIGEGDEPLEEYSDDLDLGHESSVVRFASFLDGTALNNAFNGVIRPELLRWAGHLQDYVASDIPYLASLLLWGKFYEVPEALFLRRIGPTTHASLHKERADRGDYQHDEELIVFKFYRDCFDYVRRAPNPWPEKLRLCGVLLRRVNWERDHLARELRRFVGQRLPGAGAR